MNLAALLKQKILIVDGGMGSLLQAMGLPAGMPPPKWNALEPEKVKQVHLDYLRAGADIITANTFGANSLHFPNDLEEIIKTGVTLALAALEDAGHGFAALNLGPTGRLLKPHGDLPFEQAVSLYFEAASLGAKAKADLILIETMTDAYELKAAVLGVKEACDLPIIASFTLNENGRLLTGGDIRGTVAMLESLGVSAIGLNCGFGPEQLNPFIQEMLVCASVPVLLSPNAGLPEVKCGHTHFNVGPEAFAEKMLPLLKSGLSMVGGCCGTTPAHIKAMADAVKGLLPLPVQKKTETVISSGSLAVVFDKGCKMIGERINPTGKKRLQQALREDDMDYILSEAVTQMQLKADVLDVNVGLPGIDEGEWLKKAVQAIQAVCPLPLQLDTANPDALEQALRIYNGKPLINSVSGKRSVMDKVFPLMKQYGGAVVALLLDEEGIPADVQGRLAIAEKILAEAEKYGIDKKDILFDALTMTISTDAESARVTLDTLREIKALGMGSILGVSNISFGLPERGQLNAAFLAMAVQNGLSAAILNPQSAVMTASLHSANALVGADSGFQNYIGLYAGEKAAPTTEKPAMDLSDCVLSGLEKASKESTAALLASGMPPLTIIETLLMPALDEVGKRYETGRIYLPQLLISAAAAKAAFAAVQKALGANADTKKAGKLALATVEGDVHDIGKNIVKVILENYGFEVIDLGKDVKPETVLHTVEKEGLRLVGLSALMTTTVPAMEKTIALLHDKAPHVKIMVGGAVLTESYAAQIGADCYCKDAVASVQFAKEVFLHHG
jgi:Methionine synthase I, cobalamin-binding domain